MGSSKTAVIFARGRRGPKTMAALGTATAVFLILMVAVAFVNSQPAEAPEGTPDFAADEPTDPDEYADDVPGSSNIAGLEQGAVLLEARPAAIARRQNWASTTLDEMCDRWRAIYCNENETLRGIMIDGDTGLEDADLPADWANISTLKFIIVTDTDVQGTLPDAWSKLTNLVLLSLDGNFISGTLPESWSTMANLRDLSLEGNELEGSLPASWSGMTSLRTLELDNNMLSGTLPGNWGDGMTNLRELDLDNNELTGGIPVAWSGMESLESIDLHRNNLEGEIPEEMKKETLVQVWVDSSMRGVSSRFMPFSTDEN